MEKSITTDEQTRLRTRVLSLLKRPAPEAPVQRRQCVCTTPLSVSGGGASAAWGRVGRR